MRERNGAVPFYSLIGHPKPVSEVLAQLTGADPIGWMPRRYRIPALSYLGLRADALSASEAVAGV